MELLATQTAWDRYRDRVEAVAPCVRPLGMQPNGDIHGPEGPLPWEDAEPEVVWVTADLFDEGAPLRPFFGFVRRCDSMHWLQSAAAGVDAPIFTEVLHRGVRLTNSHATAIPVAEYVVRAVLSHYQRDHEWREAQAEREWRPHGFRELHGTTWLVIGVGAIGVAIAERASAFGVRVVGCRRTPRGDEPVQEMVTPDRLDEVLPAADVVVLAAPSTRQTEGMVDRVFLQSMRPRSVLVNVARGTLVDEEALLDAVRLGVPEAAILDVASSEPLPPNSPLWSHPAITITPHAAAGGMGRHDRGAELFCQNLARYTSGRPLLNEVAEVELR